MLNSISWYVIIITGWPDRIELPKDKGRLYIIVKGNIFGHFNTNLCSEKIEMTNVTSDILRQVYILWQ